jgi:hypothetical protein
MCGAIRDIRFGPKADVTLKVYTHTEAMAGRNTAVTLFEIHCFDPV